MFAAETGNETGRSELSWHGREARELVRLAWPITVSTISYSVMTLVDTLLVGHLGPAQLAGVGLAGTMAFVFLVFPFGLLRGAKTLVAQARGAGREHKIPAILGASVLAALGIGFVIALFCQPAARLVGALAADAEAGRAARAYLSIRVLGAPLVLVFVALREVRYGHGDARSPMAATVVANIFNVVVASLFVYGFGWGARGAAWATVLAHAVEMSGLAWRDLRSMLGLRAVRFGGDEMRALWRIGWPTGLQFTLEFGSFALAATLISRMGVMQMAAHQIAIQVIHFSFLPALAVSEAASVLVGQAVGAARDELVLVVSRVALKVTSVYTFAWTLVMALCAPLVARGFTSDPALAAVAVSLLHVAALFQILDGVNVVARGTLRGAGDVRVPAWIGVATSWAATPPLAWLLGMRMHLGARGAWLGLLVEITFAAGILWARVERGRWRESAARSRAALRGERARPHGAVLESDRTLSPVFVASAAEE
jgi:MATE family multidrug resistance protein